MKRLQFYPEALLGCARTLEPHHLVFYINDTIGVSTVLHEVQAHRAGHLGRPRDDRRPADALRGAPHVLANAMGVLGVDAPERMESAPEDEDHDGTAKT